MAQRICRYLPPLLSARLGSLIYPRRTAYNDSYTFLVRSQTGSIFQGMTSDLYAGYPFSMLGFSHWRLWAIAIALCSEGDTIIEVGANIGTETIGYSDIVGASGNVYAFEPFPPNVFAIQTNMALNQRTNITVFPVALGSRSRTVPFVVPSEGGKSGLGYVVLASSQPGTTTVDVNCVTLDSLAGTLGAAKLISIDAEGSEVAILHGARTYIAHFKPAIVLEASEAHLTRAGYSLTELCSELDGMGYNMYTIGRCGLAEIDKRSKAKADWLCVHKTQRNSRTRVCNSIKRCGFLPCIPTVNPLSRRIATKAQ